MLHPMHLPADPVKVSFVALLELIFSEHYIKCIIPINDGIFFLINEW